MPNCYMLMANDGTAQLKGNAQFIAIDERMCEHFNVEPDPVAWYCDWENLIGFSLAMGRDWDYLLKMHDGDSDAIKVINWLKARYTYDAWVEIGGRR